MPHNADCTDRQFLEEIRAWLSAPHLPEPFRPDQVAARLVRIIDTQASQIVRQRDPEHDVDAADDAPPITVGATLTEMMRDLGRLVTFCNGRGDFKVGHSGQVALLALDDLDDAVAEAGTADEEWPLEGG